MAERLLVRKISNSHWQWRQVNSQGEWQNDAHYSGDINLLKEASDGKAVWLYLPGADVVTQKLEVDVKDRRLLAKLVPFEVEESVIDSIMDLAFAYGPIVDNDLAVGYVDFETARISIEELEAVGADVQHVVPDYLGLTREAGTVSILLEGDKVLVRSDDGVGFVVEKGLATMYLSAYFDEELPCHIVLTAGDESELDALHGLLPDSIDEMEDIVIDTNIGGYWDAYTLEPTPELDFRTGQLARKLPFEQWWDDWKVPAVAVLAAFVIAVGATWWETKVGKQQQREIFAERDAVYRQIVPKGAISDPVKQLKKLIKSDGETDPSHFMYMMSQVTAPLAENNTITLNNIRYSYDNKQLRLSIEAKDFALFEELRGKIDKIAGLTAKIKRSSASGEVQTAQIDVTMGG